MPGIMLRAAIRSTTSAALQYNAQHGDRQNSGVALVSALLAVGTVALNSADDRTWRALPAEISIARLRLPRGVHNATLDGHSFPLEVSGRYAVVDFRLLRSQVFVSAPKVSAPNAALVR
jgi:hypothetical protein